MSESGRPIHARFEVLSEELHAKSEELEISADKLRQQAVEMELENKVDACEMTLAVSRLRAAHKAARMATRPVRLPQRFANWWDSLEI
jgi:hypothetical protein